VIQRGDAVPALQREGYRNTDFKLRDALETLLYPGLWRLAAKHHGEGWNEIVRSLSKKAFVRSLQHLIPEIEPQDLEPCPAGVRAQAMERSGRLVEDFRLLFQRRAVHVLNAPSPAATASLAIAVPIARQVCQADR